MFGKEETVTKIFLIWRVDFDSMENREPISRRLLGYARDVIERDQALAVLQHTVETYPGKDGGWGGADTTYPKFEAQEAKQLFDNNGSDALPCGGRCVYCRGNAPLLEISCCTCDCKVHQKKCCEVERSPGKEG